MNLHTGPVFINNREEWLWQLTSGIPEAAAGVSPSPIVSSETACLKKEKEEKTKPWRKARKGVGSDGKGAKTHPVSSFP